MAKMHMVTNEYIISLR